MDSLLETLNTISGQFAGMVWGLPMVFLLFGAGLLFTVYFFFPQFRYFKHSIDITAGKYDKPEDKGEITHFQALCAALSATIGLGNIAGVAVAVASGGPGAVFWMWIAGVLGMATKLSSITLALMYRSSDDKGHMHGGPMFTIKNALANTDNKVKKGIYNFLAYMFAFSTILGAIGAGNMFQSNQMASMISESFGLPHIVTGLIFAALSAIVLIGGIKRIGNVAGKLVPFMVVIYFLGAMGIIFANIDQVPTLLWTIVTDAFTGTAAVGGFAGIAFKEVVIQGVRRAVFSNEAGLGSAAMAHCAAKSSAVQEGLVGMLGPFIDTIVVCTMTALVLLITGVWSDPNGLEGAALTASAFSTLYGDAGGYMITLIVVLFAFSSIISWSYYGEQGVEFIFGHKFVSAYKVIFVLFVVVGAVLKLGTILNFSDAFLGLMVIPNLTANIILASGLRQKLAKYGNDLKAGRI